MLRASAICIALVALGSIISIAYAEDEPQPQAPSHREPRTRSKHETNTTTGRANESSASRTERSDGRSERGDSRTEHGDSRSDHGDRSPEHGDSSAEHSDHADGGSGTPGDARTALGEQVTAEAQTIDRTLATVADKLAAADALRLRRLRAAYRILHAPLASEASDEDRMVSARRRAAARLLLDRDGAERGLLASEADRLRGAQVRAAEAATLLPTVTLPDHLAWPAKGKIARHFGIYEHERSHATLSRRGLDLEVEDHASASAPADGIVRYAGPIRGLDHGVILDHGDYFTVIAKLAELAIPVGAHVAAGDRLGRALRHRVYLEVRVKIGPGGLPIDPEPLLSR